MKNKSALKIAVIVLSIVLVIVALSTATYAIFFSESTAANPSNYKTGLLSIVANSKSEVISLSSPLPQTDEEGLKNEPYIFTISNVGNLDYQFDIKLLSTSSQEETILPQYIKLQINDGDVTTLSSLPGGVIDEDVVLEAQKSIDIKIRVWLSIDTPNSQIGKKFNSEIVTDGQAIYTKSNYSATAADYITNLYLNAEKTLINSNGVKYNYAKSIGLMNDRFGASINGYDGGNIRYYGSDPDNYIYFNCSDYDNQGADSCEVWRIVGVFDGSLKLVRASSIGAYAWDTSSADVNTGYGVSEWSEADLMKLLNPNYNENKDLDANGSNITVNNSLYWNSDKGNCYIGASNEYINYQDAAKNPDATKGVEADWCDFTNNGIKNDETRDMIATARWFTYKPSNINQYAGAIYIENVAANTWEGRVGLLSVSDYGYATDLSVCLRSVSRYATANCKDNSYLSALGTENGIWLIDASGTSNAFVLKKDGQPSNVRASYGRLLATNSNGDDTVTRYFVRPSVYLNKNIRFISGTGTSGDPYQVKLLP